MNKIGYRPNDILVIGEEPENAIPVKTSKRSKIITAIALLLLTVLGTFIVYNMLKNDSPTTEIELEV